MKNNILKEIFSDKKEKINLRYSASKTVFIIIAMFFFWIFYLTWASVWWETVSKLLSPFYLLLVISLNLFIFFGTQKLFFNKKIISYIISLLFLAFSIYLILPIIL